MKLQTGKRYTQIIKDGTPFTEYLFRQGQENRVSQCRLLKRTISPYCELRQLLTLWAHYLEHIRYTSSQVKKIQLDKR